MKRKTQTTKVNLCSTTSSYNTRCLSGYSLEYYGPSSCTKDVIFKFKTVLNRFGWNVIKIIL